MMTVTLRPWRDEDAQALQDLCSHADRRYLSGRMPFPYTLSDALMFFLLPVTRHFR